ncbi:MAG: ATP-dependent protease ATPase subunit HslU [Fusobacteriota bacterium]
MEKVLTPKNIVKELDKYIISQEDAKRDVAVSLRNRYRRKKIKDDKLKNEIMPKNIILVGPTGVGKTEIARRLAKIANAPFIKVEATKYTEVGYVGKDVESMIKDLVGMTYRNIKEEEINRLEEVYKEDIYEEIAKLLKPYDTLNDDEKDLIIKDIKEGKLDDEKVEIDVKSNPNSSVIEVYGSQPGPGGNINIQGAIDDIMGSITGKASQLKELTVKAALEYLMKERVEENLNKEELIPRVIEKVEEDGIVFIDEIDKIAERENGSKGNVSRQGVQRDILPIVEGTTIMTKYGAVKTEHILFVAAGAFSKVSPSDLMPELQGRFPVRVKMKNLTKDDFVKILTQINYNLLSQYQEMLKIDNVYLEFEKDAIEKMADYAMIMNEKVENIGARRLATVLEEILKDIMYDAPFKESKKIKITEQKVIDKLDSKIKPENLDDYIL